MLWNAKIRKCLDTISRKKDGNDLKNLKQERLIQYSCSTIYISCRFRKRFWFYIWTQFLLPLDHDWDTVYINLVINSLLMNYKRIQNRLLVTQYLLTYSRMCLKLNCAKTIIYKPSLLHHWQIQLKKNQNSQEKKKCKICNLKSRIKIVMDKEQITCLI